jgi:hypothetical protein
MMDSMQFVEAEVEIAAMTPQEREEARRKAKMLEMLQKLRITPDMDLPPLEFLFNMLGKPCFPRGEVVTVFRYRYIDPFAGDRFQNRKNLLEQRGSYYAYDRTYQRQKRSAEAGDPFLIEGTISQPCPYHPWLPYCPQDI